MCGRYTIRRFDLLPAAFRALPGPGFEEFSEHPLFNVAPSQPVLAVRMNSRGERIIGPLTWGLLPSWAKADAKARPINARCETAATSGMFRQAFERRRCLIVADGFYEWRGSRAPKVPHFIHAPDDRPLAFAGLWERWRPNPDAEPIDTCTILTTSANPVMAPIHDRMPVILHEADYDRWLDRQVPGPGVADLLRPYDGDLEAYPVSTAVNKPANNGPTLIEPAAE